MLRFAEKPRFSYFYSRKVSLIKNDVIIARAAPDVRDGIYYQEIFFACIPHLTFYFNWFLYFHEPRVHRNWRLIRDAARVTPLLFP